VSLGPLRIEFHRPWAADLNTLRRRGVWVLRLGSGKALLVSWVRL
jgi:hypothetical protein